MPNTTKFEFEKLNEEPLSNNSKQEFQQCNFRSLKNINDEKSIYCLYGTNTLEKVQADTAYEAVSKAKLKDIKMICRSNALGVKSVFVSEELSQDKTKIS